MTGIDKSAIIDAGLDYLRLTVKPGEKGFVESQNIWTLYTEQEQAKGHKAQLISLQGYRGVQCGSLFHGGREADMMFQVSGALSNSIFETMREVEFRGNVPRLDAQATIDREKAQAKSVQQLRGFLKRRIDGGKTRAVRTLALFENRASEDTLYIGSRNSSSSLRIYNAGAVHPERYSKQAQRYEGEFHNKASKQAWNYFRACANVSSCAKQVVVGKLQSVGIKERWHMDIPPIQPASGTKKTNDEKRLAWFYDQVRVSLLDLVDRGKSAEALEALGIDESFLLKCFLQDENFAAIVRKIAQQAGGEEAI
jgi:hypothetical protein